MRSKSRMALAVFVAVLAFGTFGVSSVWAYSPGPVWHLGGKAMEKGHNVGVVGKNATGTIFRVEWHEGTSVAAVVKCKEEKLREMLLEGTAPGSGHGTIRLSSCILFLKVAELREEEEPGCKIAEPLDLKVKMSLWYGGTIAEKGKKIVGVFEPEEAGLNLFKVTITQAKERPTCQLIGGFNAVGSVASEIKPQNEEAKTGALVFPTSKIRNAWRTNAKGATEEKAVGFTMGSGVSTALTGESSMEPEGVGGQLFGAYES